jgi:antitoxin MazE
MQVQLKKWGNSLGLRIPHQIAVSLGLDETSTFELLEVDGNLVLKKKPILPSLDDILASIPNDFQYPEDVADFVNSDSIGRELI